jgi:hypothetical protein
MVHARFLKGKNEAVRSEYLGKTQNLVLIDRTAC